jgi:hypothetical protein
MPTTHTLQTEVVIDAPAERVWSVLMDFAAYPEWNPFIRSIEGRAEVGQTLRFFAQPVASKGMRFRPTVLLVEKNRELRWKGNALLPILFEGEHYFKLRRHPEGGVLFEHGELFSGLLVPFLRGSLDGGVKQGFAAMNLALKRKAEAGD